MAGLTKGQMIIGITGLLCSGFVGMLYSYSAIKGFITPFGNLDQEQIGSAGEYGFIGQYTAVIPGLIVDKFGPVACILYGACVLFTGFMSMAFSIAKGQGVLLLLGITLAGQGSKGLGFGTMFGAMNTLPASVHGLIAGSYLGLDALSSIFVILLFSNVFDEDSAASLKAFGSGAPSLFFDNNLADFLALIACTVLCIGLASAAIYAKFFGKHEEEQDLEEDVARVSIHSTADNVARGSLHQEAIVNASLNAEGIQKSLIEEEKAPEKKTFVFGVVLVYLFAIFAECQGLAFNGQVTTAFKGNDRMRNGLEPFTKLTVGGKSLDLKHTLIHDIEQADLKNAYAAALNVQNAEPSTWSMKKTCTKNDNVEECSVGLFAPDADKNPVALGAAIKVTDANKDAVLGTSKVFTGASSLKKEDITDKFSADLSEYALVHPELKLFAKDHEITTSFEVVKAGENITLKHPQDSAKDHIVHKANKDLVKKYLTFGTMAVDKAYSLKAGSVLIKKIPGAEKATLKSVKKVSDNKFVFTKLDNTETEEVEIAADEQVYFDGAATENKAFCGNLVMIFALFNGVGRLLWGFAADKTHGSVALLPKASYFVIGSVMYILLFGFFAFVGIPNNNAVFACIAGLVGFTYGGLFTTITGYLKMMTAPAISGTVYGCALLCMALGNLVVGKYAAAWVTPWNGLTDAGAELRENFFLIGFIINVCALPISLYLAQHQIAAVAEEKARADADLSDDEVNGLELEKRSLLDNKH